MGRMRMAVMRPMTVLLLIVVVVVVTRSLVAITSVVVVSSAARVGRPFATPIVTAAAPRSRSGGSLF